MANNHFKFKHFTIYQDRCAMKVTTDACLFGSLISKSLDEKIIHRVLDIGTGTGLLSLMYCQQNEKATIDAVELDEMAYEQAKINFENSKWKDRLNIFHCDIKNYHLNEPYDLIICNPPFYEKQLKGKDYQRNIALHNETLSFQELFTLSRCFLKDDGFLFVLLPYYRTNEATKLSIENKLFLFKTYFVKQTPIHNFFRTICLFKKQDTLNITTEEIIIKNENNFYSEKFVDLLKDYYLNL